MCRLEEAGGRGRRRSHVGRVLATALASGGVIATLSAAALRNEGGSEGTPETTSAQRSASAVVNEALHEYDTMTATRYQAALRVSVPRGTYFYDCAGFVTCALGRVAPQARETIYSAFDISANRIPSPARYVALFGQLNGTQPGWEPVRRVVDLDPGDIVAWTYTHPHGSNGHAFIVGTVPRMAGASQYLATVWDSTATPHGPHDTRLTNPKNLLGANGKRSGLGRGQVVIDSGADGLITRVHWSPKGSAVGPATYGMGRPSS